MVGTSWTQKIADAPSSSSVVRIAPACGGVANVVRALVELGDLAHGEAQTILPLSSERLRSYGPAWGLLLRLATSPDGGVRGRGRRLAGGRRVSTFPRLIGLIRAALDRARTRAGEGCRARDRGYDPGTERRPCLRRHRCTLPVPCDRSMMHQLRWNSMGPGSTGLSASSYSNVGDCRAAAAPHRRRSPYPSLCFHHGAKPLRWLPAPSCVPHRRSLRRSLPQNQTAGKPAGCRDSATAWALANREE